MEGGGKASRALGLVAVVVTVAACGPRVVRAPAPSGETAEVVVVRPGDDGTLAIQLVHDDVKFATIKSGESATIRVGAGPHTLGARVFRFPVFFAKSTTQFTAVAGQTHYFTVNQGTIDMPPYVQPLDPDTGHHRAADSTPIPAAP